MNRVLSQHELDALLAGLSGPNSELEQASERERLRWENSVNAMRSLMRSRNGRELVRMLVDASGVLKAGYNENPHYAAFVEGKRKIGSIILELLADAGVPNEIFRKEKD